MTEDKKHYRIEGRPATIYRVVKSTDNPYVMIDRRPIDNAALSFKAKGILTYLLSRPDGWEVSVADLIKRSTDGEAAVRSGLLELKNAGHMKYTKTRQAGRITGWLIEVYEVPHSDFQDVVFQDVENQGQVLKKLSSNKENNKEKDIVDGIIQATKQAGLQSEAQNEFEAALGFGSLPWGSTFEKFGRWVRKTYEKDPHAFSRFAEWRNGDGKYIAMSNKQIRMNPDMFIDTGYPAFLAHTSMYENKNEKLRML